MRELASVRLAQDSRLPCVSEVGDPGPSGGDVSAQVESRTQLLEELVGENQSQMRHLSPEEMTAILQHELDSPVEFSLSGLGSKEAARLTRLASGQGLLLKSLRELFEHSHPPIELLEMTKDFAKAHSHQSGGEIPVEVASVIYFGAIAAAWVRHQKSITNLQTKERRRGFQWALGQTWVDGQLKRLFEDALRQLEN
jgi:hypothetical protein